MIADVVVEPDTAVAGRTLAEIEDDGLIRVLALYSPGPDAPPGTAGPRDWSPPRSHVLCVGDRVIVVASRTGLGAFLAGDRPVASSL
jgi:Trk K+ transport system NAD-binding subunit